MPKKVHKINRFHGGINNSSDPRDIDDKEVINSTNIMVDEVGLLRPIGENITHVVAEKTLDNTGAGVTQTAGSGLFYFSHDRVGGEDAGDTEDELGDNYLALYDDSDVQVWIYSESTDDWDDDKDSNENGVIDFKGKATGGAAPCYFSVDGAVRVSTGEFKKYTSGSLINDTLHFLSTETVVTIDTGSHVVVGNYLQLDDEIVYVTGVSSNDITVIRGLFGTNVVKHNDNTVVYIINMNQWYGYLNDKFFQSNPYIFTEGCTYDDAPTIANHANSDVVDGLFVSGIGIPAGAYIDSITDTTHFELSASTSGGAQGDDGASASQTLTFSNWDISNAYTTNKWYNEIQHLRSLDDLGITLALDDSSDASPAAADLVANKIIVSYWFTTTDDDVGFWNGTYWIGLTPVYVGGQEGPISTVGSSPLQINEEILNVQLYICHPSITSATVATHPLGDDRIVGVKLYTKAYTSDEWFLLKEFDLLEGGEHGWATYNATAAASINYLGGNTLSGYWDDTDSSDGIQDTLAIAEQSATASYDGADESNTCVVTLTIDTSKGAGRVGTLRLLGFENSPLYSEVSLNNVSPTAAQAITFNVINPAPGFQKFAVELLDENFNIMKRTEREGDISDSGVSSSPVKDVGSGYGGST